MLLLLGGTSMLVRCQLLGSIVRVKKLVLMELFGINYSCTVFARSVSVISKYLRIRLALGGEDLFHGGIVLRESTFSGP